MLLYKDLKDLYSADSGILLFDFFQKAFSSDGQKSDAFS